MTSATPNYSRIVLLAGRAGSGKDTAAKLLERCYEAPHVAMADPLKELAAEVFGWDRETLWGASALRDKLDERFAVEGEWFEASYRLGRRRKYADDPRTLAAWQWWLESIGVLPTEEIKRALSKWFHDLAGESYGRGLTPRRALQTLGTEFGRATLGDDVWIRAGLVRAETARARLRAPFATITDGRFLNELEVTRAAGGKVLRIRSPQADGRPVAHASEALPADAPVDAAILNDQERGEGPLLFALTRAMADLFPALPRCA
jgi:hypothetical protein